MTILLFYGRFKQIEYSKAFASERIFANSYRAVEFMSRMGSHLSSCASTSHSAKEVDEVEKKE